MRVVVAPDSFGTMLDAAAAAQAIADGWRRAAPDDDLVLLPFAASDPAGELLDAALDQAGLAVTGEESFDWASLRDSIVTAVAGAAAELGVPCVVMAGRVSVGRREAAAVGVDAAYAVSDGAGADPAEALSALAERVARRWSS